MNDDPIKTLLADITKTICSVFVLADWKVVTNVAIPNVV